MCEEEWVILSGVGLEIQGIDTLVGKHEIVLKLKIYTWFFFGIIVDCFSYLWI